MTTNGVQLLRELADTLEAEVERVSALEAAARRVVEEAQDQRRAADGALVCYQVGAAALDALRRALEGGETG